jgi:signal transduction histidine kinase
MTDAPKARLLIVDDEASLMHALCNVLGQQGYATTGCSDAASAMERLRGERFDLMLTDLMMPQVDGLALATDAMRHDPAMVVVMMTGEGSIPTAVSAMRSGVLDYVLKPFKLGTMLPVLERALAVRQLRRDNDELQQRLRDRTQQLELANAELEAYAATVSHDLRAPLRGIEGMTRLLVERMPMPQSADAQRLLGLIGSRVQRAQRLVEDLLALSRIGRRPLERRVVDVSRLVREVAAELLADAAGSHARIVVGDPLPEAQADPSLLRQAFANLLGNALKFTEMSAGAHIEVAGESTATANIYRVVDNGPGFDMKHADRLFKPFERLPGAEAHEGSGVGLSIVARIVHRHGGRIWAESAVGQGARFYFTLGPPEVPGAGAGAGA